MIFQSFHTDKMFILPVDSNFNVCYTFNYSYMAVIKTNITIIKQNPEG